MRRVLLEKERTASWPSFAQKCTVRERYRKMARAHMHRGYSTRVNVRVSGSFIGPFLSLSSMSVIVLPLIFTL